MEKPLWLDAMVRVGVSEPRPGRRPPRIDFPEDRLLAVYYQKYPEAKLEAVDLTSFEPPAARRFVLRQQQLMEQGVERKAAFAAVETENEAAGLHPGGISAAALASSSSAEHGGSIIEAIQAEEEAELNAGLAEYVARHGPIAPPKRSFEAGGRRSLARNPYSERLRSMQAVATALKAPKMEPTMATGKAGEGGSSSSSSEQAQQQ